MPTPPANGAAPPVLTLPDLIGKPPEPPSPDPAWQPATDPLAKPINPGIVHREIPIVVVATGWDVPQARAALEDLVIGIFDAPAQLADSVMRSDSRVQAALTSRLSILGRPVDFRIPRKYRDSDAARECRDAFIDAWPTMAAESAIGEIARWGMMMGFAPAQILWDTSGEYATPRPLPWHPRYTYYHWNYRCYVAITLDGQEPIMPGNGSWILHAPFGDYRGWMRGAVSAITPWWLARAYALRDAARWSERMGLDMILAKTPAVGDPNQQAAFRNSLANLGQETVIHLPQNPAPALSYSVELLQSNGVGFDGFFRLIDRCNEEITLALLAQTLTTSMPAEGGSSYAAARVHASVLQGLMEADARALANTVYYQIARPFAALNFGNPDLAPRVVWDVTPFEDAKTKALAAMQLAEALNFLRVSGFKISPRDVRRMFKDTIPGFDLGSVIAADPLAVESVAAKAKADEKAQNRQAREDVKARARIAPQALRFDPRVLDHVRVDGGDGWAEALAIGEASDADRLAGAMRRRMRL